MTVALLGTGLLGRAIAERLQATHHSVIAYNRTAARALPLQACGVTVVTLPEQAIVQADVVLLVLADASAIRAVLLAPAVEKLLRGRTIVQMGTIAPEESTTIQREIDRLGGTYCEARSWAVLPKRRPARCRSWWAARRNSSLGGHRCSVPSVASRV